MCKTGWSRQGAAVQIGHRCAGGCKAVAGDPSARLRWRLRRSRARITRDSKVLCPAIRQLSVAHMVRLKGSSAEYAVTMSGQVRSRPPTNSGPLSVGTVKSAGGRDAQ